MDLLVEDANRTDSIRAELLQQKRCFSARELQERSGDLCIDQPVTKRDGRIDCRRSLNRETGVVGRNSFCQEKEIAGQRLSTARSRLLLVGTGNEVVELGYRLLNPGGPVSRIAGENILLQEKQKQNKRDDSACSAPSQSISVRAASRHDQ